MTLPAQPHDRLTVYKANRIVGTLVHDASGRLTFAYDAAVQGDQSAALSILLPVRRQAYDHLPTAACFENLLPEGDLRSALAAATHHDARDVAGLLGVIGGECAGALRLWPADQRPPATDEYEPCGQLELRAALGMANDLARQMGVQQEGRMSMSGAQDKIVAYRRPPTGLGKGGQPAEYLIPKDGAPTTVLLKRSRRDYPGLVQNEIAAMTLMEAAGVPTALRTACSLDTEIYETVRFDRVLQADGSILRLHAEDGCQITGRTSLQKYAWGGGPTYRELSTVLQRNSTDPIADIEALFRWAVANMCLGNSDAHAKNVSVLHQPTPGRIRLAPAYDVVCTVVYPGIDQDFALTFGGQSTRKALRKDSLDKASREFQIGAPLARELVADAADRIVKALPDALHRAATDAGVHPILSRMEQTIAEETAAVRAVLVG